MENRGLSPEEIQRMGVEIDAVRAKILSKIGETDARYIKNVVKAVRYSQAAGRILLFAGVFPPAWILGTLLLSLSKILENMELGHNVLHGQYDWMNDPYLSANSYEWDVVGTSESWKQTHNFMHHMYTNVQDVDADLGFGLLRVFPEQRWRPWHVAQPLYAILMALFFEWGIAFQDLKISRSLLNREDIPTLIRKLSHLQKKIRRQLLKDYVIFPLLSGPFFLYTLSGNFVANVIRNIWAFMCILCGHLTSRTEIFPQSVLDREPRAQWYLRQIRSSSNFECGGILRILSGHLGYQIEHHLFPELPACRYAEISHDIRDICRKYGQRYNTGPFGSQVSQAFARILRHAVPSQRTSTQ